MSNVKEYPYEQTNDNDIVHVHNENNLVKQGSSIDNRTVNFDHIARTPTDMTEQKNEDIKTNIYS